MALASQAQANHVIKYCGKVSERSGKNLFWSIKNSCEVLNKLKSRGFHASSLSTYDFSTLYTTLPHNFITDKLVDLIERTFQREGSLYIACNDRNAFFTSDAVRNYNLWSCQKVCEAVIFLLDNIYIVCIPVLVTTFPEWLSGTEPLPHTPGAVRPSSSCV